MSTSNINTETMGNNARTNDLARLRTRLWRLSSLLTCGVLVLALGAAWAASAVMAQEANNAALVNARLEAHWSDTLVAAKYLAEDRALDALKSAFEREQESSGPFSGYRPSASAPDGDIALGSSVNTPFTVMVFEDGRMTFTTPPTNVLSSDMGPEYSWNTWNVAKLVEEAIETREAGSNRMPPQRVRLGDMTWLWTTWIFVTNPNYDPEQPYSNTEVSVYTGGELEDYRKDGYLAARVFTFTDITPSVQMLDRLAIALVAAGVVGCVLLVIVCRKIIDRALKPVGEAQVRQREFLIKASHELKTPMASLSSNLDALVANAGETVESQAQWTDNMREDIDQLADRTCALLDLVTAPGEGVEDRGDPPAGDASPADAQG